MLSNSTRWPQMLNAQTILPVLLSVSLVILVALSQLLKPVDRCLLPFQKKWKLPPGPKGWPVIGNLLLYRKGEAGALELASYGEMTTSHIGSKLWVVINSNRLVTELYGRKGSVTNGRPPYPMVSDLISLSRRSVLLPSSSWAPRRKVMHQLLSGTALTRYQEYQEEESAILLSNYLQNPQQWYVHNHMYSNSVIHRCTFGERPDTNEKKLANLLKVQSLFLLNAPPLNFWDNFPGLAKLPKALQFWRRRYLKMGRETCDAYSAYWTPLKERIEQGNAPQSFARDVILGEGKYDGDETDRMFLAMQLVEAGSDTTRLATNIFVLAAVTHPDKFLKARAEVDRICGADAQRLPCIADESDLSYINAFAKEMLRWRRIFDWTPEHMLTEDLDFEGYCFPKGTNFVINHAAIANDEAVFPSPKEFLPERWLNGHEAELWDGNWQFGHGRRLCVGNRLAQRSLFLLLSRLTYCFDFKARAVFNSENINHFAKGEPFPIEVSVRGSNFADLIRIENQRLKEEHESATGESAP